MKAKEDNRKHNTLANPLPTAFCLLPTELPTDSL